MNNKIIRTICSFTSEPSIKTLKFIDEIGEKLTKKGYEIQTKRICSKPIDVVLQLDKKYADGTHIFSAGSLSAEKIKTNLEKILKAKDTSFNLDLTNKQITNSDVEILFNIISLNASKTFNFTYVFNNKPQTPFFPSASYVNDGFSVGLQPTDFSENCKSLDEWLNKVKKSWEEVHNLLNN